MGDGSLSQEEIDALLMGADDMGGGDSLGGGSMDLGMGGGGGAAPSGGGISPSEREILADNLNEAMQLAGSSISGLVGKNVSITNASIEEINASQGASEVQPGSVLVNINMGSAQTAMVFSSDLAKSISMAMLGTTEMPDELADAHLSTLGELANTVLGSISNSLADKFKEGLQPSPPNVVVYSGQGEWPGFQSEKVAKVTYNIAIEGASPAKLVHYINGSSASSWAKNSSGGAGGGSNDMAGFDDLGMGGMGGGDMMGATGGGGQGSGVPINPVSFPSFQSAAVPSQTPPNLELLLDVQMVLTVELGRTKKYVKDILSLGEGSIIELDKLAGEPVDLLINGKLIAKGEVVVIDENFGVRVTDIVGPAERLGAMM